MNKLSQLLYFADVSSSISVKLIISTIILLLIAAGTTIATGIHNDNKYEENRLPYWPRIRGFLAGAMICSLLTSLIPTRTTVYMIAASQFGEQIIQSDDAQMLRTLLRQRIETVLTEATTPSKK